MKIASIEAPAEFGFPLSSLAFSFCGGCSRLRSAEEEAVEVFGWVTPEDGAEECGPAEVSGEVQGEAPVAADLADSAGETAEAEALQAAGDGQ
jgi:hypothetical protein